jgi:hypothetical protein
MSKAKSVPYDEELIVAIEQLTEQVQLLGHVIDDLTSELQWQNRNQPRDREPPAALTSMPLDPTTPDWQINQHSAADLPPAPQVSGTPRRPARTLFD